LRSAAWSASDTFLPEGGRRAHGVRDADFAIHPPRRPANMDY